MDDYAGLDGAYRDNVIEGHHRFVIVVVRRGRIRHLHVINAGVYGKSRDIIAVEDIIVYEGTFGHFAHTAGKRYAQTFRSNAARFAGEGIHVVTCIIERHHRFVDSESYAYLHPFGGRSVVVVGCRGISDHDGITAGVDGHIVINAAFNVSQRYGAGGQTAARNARQSDIVRRNGVRKRVVSIYGRLISGAEGNPVIFRKIVALYDDRSYERSHRPRSYPVILRNARLVVNDPHGINSRVGGRDRRYVSVNARNVVDASRGSVAVLEVKRGVAFIEFGLNSGHGIGIDYGVEILAKIERYGLSVVNLALGFFLDGNFRKPRRYLQTFGKHAVSVEYRVNIDFRVAIVIVFVGIVYRQNVVNACGEYVIIAYFRRSFERIVRTRFAEFV